MWRLAVVVAILAAAVLLPKAVPAALLGPRIGEGVERFLGLLPPALLGGLVVVSAAGAAGARPQPAVLVAVAIAAGMAALTRRSLLAMAGGWAALAIGLALS